MAFSLLSALSVLVIICSATKRENTSLLLVQTISRHGDRAPDVLYPNDPNTDNCFPNGLGQLTQLGWQQIFDLGVFLRSLYGDFVPEDPKEIFVNSSGKARCLESAAALITSFYPTEVEKPLTKPLYWKPIPVHYVPKGKNKYLDYNIDCPRANAEFYKAMGITDNKQKRKNQATAQKLSKLSGFDFSNLTEAALLSFAVEEEIIHNCTVPEWAYEYYDVMHQRYAEYLLLRFSSLEQTRLRVGPLLGLLNNNMKKKIDGKTDLKFILNMSHDGKVAGILAALNFTIMQYPPFCSTLLFELHQMTDSSKTVRLRYINTTSPLDRKEEQPVLLVLDGCTEFCPVDYFMESYQSLIPDDWEKECQIDIKDTSDMLGY